MMKNKKIKRNEFKINESIFYNSDRFVLIEHNVIDIGVKKLETERI